MGANIGQFCDLETNKYNGYDISYDLVRYMNTIYDVSEINYILRHPENFSEFENSLFFEYKNAIYKKAPNSN